MFLGKFGEALELVRAPELRQKHAFEAAYCLYRTNELADAQALADSVQTPTPHATSLRAQIAFARGDYARCCALYEQLVATKPAGIDADELLTNLLAAYVAAGQSTAATRTQFIAANEVPRVACVLSVLSRVCMFVVVTAAADVSIRSARSRRRGSFALTSRAPTLSTRISSAPMRFLSTLRVRTFVPMCGNKLLRWFLTFSSIAELLVKSMRDANYSDAEINDERVAVHAQRAYVAAALGGDANVTPLRAILTQCQQARSRRRILCFDVTTRTIQLTILLSLLLSSRMRVCVYMCICFDSLQRADECVARNDGQQSRCADQRAGPISRSAFAATLVVEFVALAADGARHIGALFFYICCMCSDGARCDYEY